MDPKHLLHQLIIRPITADKERLQTQHPFVAVACQLLNDLPKVGIRAAQWIDYKWHISTLKINQSYASLPQHPVPDHLEWVCSDLLGLMLEDFGHPCLNGDLLLHQFVNVVH